MLNFMVATWQNVKIFKSCFLLFNFLFSPFGTLALCV